MKNYELVCIFDPQVGEGQFEQAVERYKTYITDNGGEIVNVDLWGLRRMAYTSQSLKNRRQGYYVLYQFTAEPTFVEPMEPQKFIETVDLVLSQQPPAELVAFLGRDVTH